MKIVDVIECVRGGDDRGGPVLLPDLSGRFRIEIPVDDLNAFLASDLCQIGGGLYTQDPALQIQTGLQEKPVVAADVDDEVLGRRAEMARQEQGELPEVPLQGRRDRRHIDILAEKIRWNEVRNLNQRAVEADVGVQGKGRFQSRELFFFQELVRGRLTPEG